MPSLIASCYTIQLIFLEVLLLAEERWRESRSRGEERGRRVEEKGGVPVSIYCMRGEFIKKDLQYHLEIV